MVGRNSPRKTSLNFFHFLISKDRRLSANLIILSLLVSGDQNRVTSAGKDGKDPEKFRRSNDPFMEGMDVTDTIKQ